MKRIALLAGGTFILATAGCANQTGTLTPTQLAAGQLLVSVVTASSPQAAGIIAKGQQICRIGEDLKAVYNADTGSAILVTGQAADTVDTICKLLDPMAVPTPLQTGLVAVATPVTLPAAIKVKVGS